MQIFRREEGGQSPDNEKQEYNWRGGVYLCTVNDSFQADLLESKLRSEGIPCQKKYVGSSNYLEIVFGSNLTGDIELYVPESCLEDAKNVIVPVDLDDCDTEDEPMGEEQE
jgi:hypothetical protein